MHLTELESLSRLEFLICWKKFQLVMFFVKILMTVVMDGCQLYSASQSD
jgi:hypothetical protein